MRIKNKKVKLLVSNILVNITVRILNLFFIRYLLLLYLNKGCFYLYNLLKI